MPLSREAVLGPAFTPVRNVAPLAFSSPPARRQRRRAGGEGENFDAFHDPVLKDGANAAARKRLLKQPQIEPRRLCRCTKIDNGVYNGEGRRR
jgi:hypothetical protein